tara:strand:- start:1089 stop:1238 length:150 start_codon:yes stop_codon:yes gene_type:complete
MRYINNKNYRIVQQVVPYKNNQVIKFEQLFKRTEENGWIFIKDLNSETI